jgi:hypothetical protein
MKRQRAAEAEAALCSPPARQATLATFFTRAGGGAVEEVEPPAAAARSVAAFGAVVRLARDAPPPCRGERAWGGRHFACPFGDARHPSAGDGALDAVRRGGASGRPPQLASPAAAASGAAGWQRRNLCAVLRAAAHAPPLRLALSDDDASFAERLLSLSPAAQALLAALYYAPSDGFHRLRGAGGRTAASAPALEHLGGDGDGAYAELLREGLVCAAEDAAPALLPPAALARLLSAPEAAAALAAAGKRVAPLGGAAAALSAALSQPRAERLRAAALAACRPSAAVAPDAGESLLRLHRTVLVLSSYAPDEAACLLAQDIDALQLRPPPAAIAAARLGPRTAALAAANALHAAAAVLDDVAAAALRGDGDGAAAALHAAASALLGDADEDASCAADEAACHVVAALRSAARAACCRAVLRAATLLERDRRGGGDSDAVTTHYLQALLSGSAAARRCAACAPLRHAAALRLALALERAGSPAAALAAAEAALGCGDGADCGAAPPAGAVRVGLARLASRLAVPPLRWRARADAVPPPPAAPEARLSLPRARGTNAWMLPGGGETPSVEAAVLATYAAQQPPWRGAHAENGPLVALFSALFADVIADAAAPGAWLSPLADAPLDFGRGIAAKRPAATAARLAAIAAASAADLAAQVFAAAAPDGGGAHTRGAGAPCALRRRELAAVAGALGGPSCAAVCAAFAASYDAAAAGFPDLLLWRDAPGDAVGGGDVSTAPAPASAVRFVEVKGPGDRLSDRQRAAHALLLAAGVRCCVCYVAAAPPGAMPSLQDTD